MLQTFSFQRINGIFTVILICGAFGVTLRAQEITSTRPVLDFDGNKVFSKQELLDVANKCLDRVGESGKPYETEQLDYCLHKVLSQIRQKGYLQARFDKTLYEQNENVNQAIVPVNEGALYRVGEIKIENAKVLAPAQIVEMVGLKTGDVADGEKLASGIFERAKQAYGSLGYIQYTAEITPTFHLKDRAEEGVADFLITVDEGPQFKIGSIKFAGGDKSTIDLLRRELMVHDGEVFNPDLLNEGIARMKNTGLYDRIDPDRDVEYHTNEKAALLDLTIRLKKRIATSVSH